jgi:SET domain-containing protein
MPKKQHPVRHLVAKRSSAGLGLYTKEPIEKGGFVIEYVGKILTRKESNEKGGKYLFETSRDRVIDGTDRKNIARYINHSCDPNCEIDIVRGRVFVSSIRPIKAGEELTYDYGKEYYDEFIKPHGCRCSAKKHNK